MKPILGKILLDKKTLFLPTYQRQNSTLRILFIIQWSAKLQVSHRAWILKYQFECDKVQWLQTHCGQALISLGKSLYKDILYLCPQWSSGPYVSRNFLIWTHFVNRMHLEKNRTYARTFPVQRKEINVVKVRFTTMYSWRKFRKLRNKIITTAYNLWRQITCSF